MNRCAFVGAVSVAAMGSLWLAPHTASAALVLYEGFEYGGASVALNTVSGTPVGLASGAYTGGGTYNVASLAFGALEVSGGSATVSASGSASVIARKQLATGPITGNIWGSYLYRNTQGVKADDVTALLFGTSAATDNTAEVAISPNEYPASGPRTDLGGIRAFNTNTGTSGGGATTLSGVLPATADTLTMVLFSITNVGAVSGSQVITAWILTEPQFTHFKAGGLTDAELNAASLSTNSTDILQRGTRTLNGASYISLTSDDWMSWLSKDVTANIDEIRLSNASLDEVTPVPEPAALSVLGLSALTVTARKRRRG